MKQMKPYRDTQECLSANCRLKATSNFGTFAGIRLIYCWKHEAWGLHIFEMIKAVKSSEAKWN